MFFGGFLLKKTNKFEQVFDASSWLAEHVDCCVVRITFSFNKTTRNYDDQLLQFFCFIVCQMYFP